MLIVRLQISYFRDYENKRGDRDAEARLRRTPVAEQCRAHGPGLEGGEALIPGLFVIEARNARGELIPLGGFPFSAKCVDPHGREVPVVLKDNGDGVVDASYTPVVAGNHIVTVQLSGQDVGGAGGSAKSPFKVLISSAVVDPSKCQIFGPGVEGGNVGAPAKFTVQTVNRFGTPITEGGAPLHLKVQGPVDGGSNPRVQKASPSFSALCAVLLL